MHKDVYYSLAAIIGLGVLGVGTASAEYIDTNTTPTDTSRTQSPPVEMRESQGHRREHARGIRPDYLAEALGLDANIFAEAKDTGTSIKEILDEQGITKEQVKEAMDAFFQKKIEDALASGKITQEQAQKRIEAHEKRREAHEDHKEEHMRVGATLMGITPEELQTKLDSGKKMKDLFEEYGVEKEVVKDAMEEVRKEHLAELVAEGKITQEQANKMQEHGRKMGHQPKRGLRATMKGGAQSS